MLFRSFAVVARGEEIVLAVLIVAVGRSAVEGTIAGSLRFILSFFSVLSRERFLLIKLSIGISGTEEG